VPHRLIPSSGEPLAVIGCGTYRGFDVAPQSEGYRRLPGVLDALLAAGGSMLDSSPMYGRAEAAVGALLSATPARSKVFLATKVWTRGTRRRDRADAAVAGAVRDRADRPDAGA